MGHFMLVARYVWGLHARPLLSHMLCSMTAGSRSSPSIQTPRNAVNPPDFVSSCHITFTPSTGEFGGPPACQPSFKSGTMAPLRCLGYPCPC